MELGRPRGLYLRGGTWWVSLSVGGRRFRLSTGVQGGSAANPPRAAVLFHAQKLTEIGRGNVSGLQSYRLTVRDLIEMLLTRYRAERRPAATACDFRTRRLLAQYGGWKATEFNTDELVRYAVRRRDEDHAAIATINSELKYVRRAYGLAHRSGRIAWIPHVPRLPGTHVRQGVVGPDVLSAILKELAEHYRPIIRFLRLTGRRESDALNLEWRYVDWTNREILLPTTKTGKPWSLPFRTYPPLDVLLREQQAVREAFLERGVIVGSVFPNRRGQRTHQAALQRAWIVARNRAGVGRVLIHDLRRQFISDMERLHIPRPTAMRISGHESEAVYTRYAIVSAQDVDDALETLANAPSVEGVVVRMPVPKNNS